MYKELLRFRKLYDTRGVEKLNILKLKSYHPHDETLI